MLLKAIILLVMSLGGISFLNAQLPQPAWPDSLFSPYYHQRVTHFETLPRGAGAIVFIGNSITDGGEWGELFGDLKVRNRGISGDLSAGLLNRLGGLIRSQPSKVFLMIGINDLARGIRPDSIARNIWRLVAGLHAGLPAVQVYIQSTLPVNADLGRFSNHTNKTEAVQQLNALLAAQAASRQYTFVDLYPSFCNAMGRLDTAFTNDGLHLSGAGYLLWKHLIFPYVYGYQERAALIPMPRQLQWNEGFFPLYQCKTILTQQEGLQKEAQYLQKEIQKVGWAVDINDVVAPGSRYIELQLVPASKNAHPEAYELAVSEQRILITAATTHGIFNGIQTLIQLWRDGIVIDRCWIRDAPAFSWRGYLIDVGRNYLSPALLKQQIDYMSRYKLNVFHFHATEDIAWRLEIKKYPQLTAPENMLRNKGMYYTQEEIADLIAYCRERHIEFVPEIDMPGHSAAFKRAMLTDMQSDSGLAYVKAILDEFCETYEVPYIHIGADEVAIHNQDFLPEVIRLLERRGKKVIGWQPGGHLTNSTIRQLWMGNQKPDVSNPALRYIDSRHLYLNHMDPLEAVVTLFNRQIGSREREDAAVWGGTLCMWHDRAVHRETDILSMNPVYPGMVAFSERIWRGGGVQDWVANLSDGDQPSFLDFEQRLLDHKSLYFKDRPFPYVRQGHLEWALWGPYLHQGAIDAAPPPQTQSFFATETSPVKKVRGGTVVLRHWWAPLIKGAVDDPQENTTWYASTSIWSDTDGKKSFWIGFNDLSRSPATDSPPAGQWDTKGSKVWVNEQEVPAPQWVRPNQKGHSEIPLIDEGYAFRIPTVIKLRKGWNRVVVKAPVTTFKGKDWQNPVKWMFTFVPVEGNGEGR